MGNAACLGRLFDFASRVAAKRRMSGGHGGEAGLVGSGPERLESRAMFAAAPMQVGMNLENVVDWSPAWTFTDAFQSSRPWIAQAVDVASGAGLWDVGDAHPLPVNAKGEITRFETWTENGRQFRHQAATLLFRDVGTYASGTYHAQWEGTGTVSFGFDARVLSTTTGADGIHRAELAVTPTSAGILVRIESTDPADPVRGIHVWMPDWKGKSFAGEVWKPGAAFSPFHPLFLERLDPFATIRFMGWQETNSSSVRTVADARPADAARQSSGPGGSPSEPKVNGVSIEQMVQLANDLDADPWFNMPPRADDGYVRAFAQTVRDRLEPGRKVYVEWSNEIWNWGWGFDGARYVDEVAVRPEYAGLDHWQIAGREAKRDLDIWSDVFAGQTSRLVRVAAGQAANEWIVDRVASAMGGSFDVLAIAPYILPTDQQRATYTAATTVDTILADCRTAVDTASDWTRRHKALADTWSKTLGRSVSLVAYEGGVHLDSRGSPAQQAFYDASNDRRMGELYRQYLQGLATAGMSLYVDFQFTGQSGASPWGDFAKLHAMDEPVASAWRYAAVVTAADGSLFRPAPRPPIDFDGDGVGDVVWRDATTGACVAWLLDAGGATKGTRALGGGGGVNALATIGDFDGDGVSDLVWRNKTTGVSILKLLRADGTAKGTASLGGSATWQIETSDDFDGDGRDDLVWRHGTSGSTVIWLMNAGRVVASATIGGDAVWRLVSTSGRYDADGDGRADLLWRNGTTGTTVLWLMNGLAKRSATTLGGDARWEVVASGDFDRDGRGDLVWRDRIGGTAVVWLMNGATALSSRALMPTGLSSPAVSWSIVATLSAGTTGRPGIVVRETASGRSLVWWMDGVAINAAAPLGGDGRVALLRRPGRAVG